METKPKIIHQYTPNNYSESSNNLSKLIQDSWKTKNPQWQYKAWDNAAILKFISQNYNDLTSKILQSNIELKDIARYYILYKEGGIFVNEDYVCLNSFDNLATNKALCLTTITDNNNLITDSILISSKQHPFIAFIITQILDNIKLYTDSKIEYLNTLYRQYPLKEEIQLIPSSVLNPCTKNDIIKIKLGGQFKQSVEDKLDKAFTCCMHIDKLNNLTVYNEKSTDVLYMSTYADGGGQFIAANRIHQGLCSIGINSKLLVMGSNFSHDAFQQNIVVAKPKTGEFYGPANDNLPLASYPNHSKEYKFSPAIAGIDINRYIKYFNPKFVQFHWINNGYIKIEDIAKIDRSIIWRLADCWAFTGGCFYFGECTRYLQGCGKCPKLGSNNINDLSHEVWLRKQKAYKNIDLSIVVPSVWMKTITENSTLLKGREVTVIPNGIDLNEFYPISKVEARKALNIPLDRKIILYGAGQPMHPRKGYNILKQALEKLTNKYKNKFFFVIFGNSYNELNHGIPSLTLGYLKQHHQLRLAYSAADIMIVPSLEESFGQTVTEAMACGTPVIAFRDTGPASTIIHKHNGYLANFADYIDLANGIEWCLSDDKTLTRMSENARTTIESKYDIAIIAQQYQELYAKLAIK